MLTNLLYVLFILLPGYVAYASAGYSVDEKGSVTRIIYRGATVFFLVNAIAIIFSNTPVVQKYFEMFRSAPEDIDNLVFIGAVTVYVFGGFVVGWLQLYLEYKTLWSAKKEIKGWLNMSTGTVEIKPGNNLKRIFTCYRLANKKPFVTVFFDKEKSIQGEVLKYNWNGREELLMKNADTCDLFVVNISKCYAVEFKNIQELDNLFNLRRREASYLDLIHPGLSELIRKTEEREEQ